VFSQAAYHGEMDRKEHMEKVRPPLEHNARGNLRIVLKLNYQLFEIQPFLTSTTFACHQM
jgi:hypothetical protein